METKTKAERKFSILKQPNWIDPLSLQEYVSLIIYCTLSISLHERSTDDRTL